MTAPRLLLEQLMFPRWVWVVRSDRRAVTVPPTSSLERWASYFLRQSASVAVARLWTTIRSEVR